MKFEINKELVLSTAHVKESTLNGCFNEDYIKQYDYSTDEYGVRLHVSMSLSDFEDSGIPFPSELVNLLKIAKENDCKWLVLDCDGDEVEGLPTFDW